MFRRDERTNNYNEGEKIRRSFLNRAIVRDFSSAGAFSPGNPGEMAVMFNNISPVSLGEETTDRGG